jgi:predicted Zn-dependent peptidase
VIGQLDLGLESTENQMHWAGEQLVHYGRVFAPETIRRRIAAVRAAEVRAAARDFFRPERLSFSLISPVESVAPLRRILRSF